MKKLTKLFVLLLTVGLLAISCSKEEEEKNYPKISNFELGSGHYGNQKNNAKGLVGRDIHIAAEIFASNKIEKVVVVIHPKGEHQHDGKNEEHKDEWEVKKEYTDLAGQINGTFHQHIDIPKETEPGIYHFHFKVVDKKGLTTKIDRDLTIIEKKHKH